MVATTHKRPIGTQSPYYRTPGDLPQIGKAESGVVYVNGGKATLGVADDTPDVSYTLRDTLDAYSAALSRRLGIKQPAVLKVLTWWTIRYPNEFRHDGLQELVTAALHHEPGTPGLLNSVCRAANSKWYSTFYYVKYQKETPVSVSEESADTDGVDHGLTVVDGLAGTVEFELQVNGEIDAGSIWKQLPERVQRLVRRKLQGKRLGETDARYLSRFAKQNTRLLLQS